MKKNPVSKTDLTDFHTAWNWLRRHPAFFYKGKMGAEHMIAGLASSTQYGFFESLEIDIVKVDPKTNRIEDDSSRNTATRVWLECGPWGDPKDHPSWGDTENIIWKGIPSHDINLDCGGETFERAIIKLASLVLTNHGDHNNTED